jgi:NADH dehydrogenase
LSSYPLDLSAQAEAMLMRLGVTVRTGSVVTDIQPEAVTVRCGEQQDYIPSRTVLWGAGVQASPLGRHLAEATGAELDRAGRIVVASDLSIPQHPEIFVIGDLAHLQQPTGTPLPGVAPVAMQQGRYVARLISERLHGNSLSAFHYRDRGHMAIIGRAAAVADFGRLRFTGFLAWIAWLFVHVMSLVEYENRLLVLVQWAWNFLTSNRSARLITGESPLPLSVTQAERIKNLDE